jgi:hypothetical protein
MEKSRNFIKLTVGDYVRQRSGAGIQTPGIPQETSGIALEI